MKKLETERLVLRSFKEEDLKDFYEYAKSPNVGPNAGWKPHESEEETLQILTRFMEHDNVWAIELKDSHKVIGSLGLHDDEKRTNTNGKMIGYVLSDKYWGRGIMTEAVKAVMEYAFEEENYDILTVYHYVGNKKSKRVIEKCGFKYEGKLRFASRLYNGEVVDDLCYSLSKNEYLEIKSYREKIFIYK